MTAHLVLAIEAGCSRHLIWLHRHLETLCVIASAPRAADNEWPSLAYDFFRFVS